MICEKLDACGSRISSFVYEKACLGHFKYVYCPQARTKDSRKPHEWTEFYQSLSERAIKEKDD